ncbi:MAG: UDP-glucose--hexose-1-phosphate uridylyltransferase [Acidimicrobiales bacterium]|jgi:UDPglucose--hexose-1-phosphate uridylyltransferase
MSFLEDSSHRRFNPLTGEWVLVSPHRAQRPWLGQVERGAHAEPPPYDPSCYLCPGNARANGEHNPPYTHTFAFDNDFPALLPGAPRDELDQGDLLLAAGESGICRVICFTPRHDLALARMEATEVAGVVAVWREQFMELAAGNSFHSVQIFENQGEMMGASNPHPHCQIWASASVTNELAKETAALERFSLAHGSCLLCGYAALEEELAERTVYSNGSFVAVVPFWAVWPFETMVLPRRHLSGLDQFRPGDVEGFADALHAVTVRYENLFEAPFPYSMGIHQRPTDGLAHDGFHLHAHFLPPLLRSATVRKFMVGFELFGSPQRDITAEDAAARLRDLSGTHYLDSDAG